MANYTTHNMIVTHEDKSKVNELYNYSYSNNFFEKIFPRPAEFINDTNGETARFQKDFFISDRLARWRRKNWGANDWPFYELGDFRKLSKSGTIFTTRFALRAHIPAPFGIYDELHRQGFLVKAYYCESSCYCYCGSYIYGVHEHFEYKKEGQDVPDDMNWCFNFNVQQYYSDYKPGKPPEEIAHL